MIPTWSTQTFLVLQPAGTNEIWVAIVVVALLASVALVMLAIAMHKLNHLNVRLQDQAVQYISIKTHLESINEGIDILLDDDGNDPEREDIPKEQLPENVVAIGKRANR